MTTNVYKKYLSGTTARSLRLIMEVGNIYLMTGKLILNESLFIFIVHTIVFYGRVATPVRVLNQQSLIYNKNDYI